jgi:hypothetical protein
MACPTGFPVFSTGGGGTGGPLRSRLLPGDILEICNDLGCTTVSLSGLSNGPERQRLRLQGNILSIEDGNGAIINSVDLSALIGGPSNPQNLSLTGSWAQGFSLSISGGNTVSFPPPRIRSAFGTVIIIN